MRDVTVDTVLQSTGLGMTAAEEDHFACSHHSTNSHRQSLFRNQVEVAIKEAAVGVNGIGGQRLDTCLAAER